MKLKNMTGYMLGNPNNVHHVGEVWTGTDCRVWVCATVVRVMYNKDVRQITDADLIVNARRHCGRFAQLMRSLERENVR